jgi:hypothetical protein
MNNFLRIINEEIIKIVDEGDMINPSNKYENVRFSDKFYGKDKGMIKYLKKTYLEKIENFINFYNKYKPDGIRIINGRDTYKESKVIFDKIISGDLYIDDVFTDPDNTLRNVVMLQHLDEPALKRRMNI